MRNRGKKDYLSLTMAHIKNGGSGVYLLAIICFEIICLSVLFFRGISRPKSVLDYAASNFFYEELENVNIEDESLIFSQAEGVSNEQIQTVSGNMFSLTSGAYQFYISYDSDTDGNGDYTKSTGSFTIVSNHHEIETDTVTFDDGHEYAVGRFWIPAFSHCDDLYFVVRYNGQGLLKIKDCKVAEYRRYRAIRFVGFVALFILVDILYIVFFTDYLVKFNKIIVAILMIMLAASVPFIDDIVYNGHDLWFHMVRIVTISQGLAEGQFPVRISSELNNGFGYANSLYYCDIFLYLSAILYKFRVPLRICYQFYAILINAATGIFTYYAMSKFTKVQSLKIIGTMLYMLCTYRLVNMNIRSAVGEYTAMCFLPLIVVGLYNILKKEDVSISDWFPLTAGMSGVIMSHIVTAEMLVINIAILCVMSLFRIIKVKRIIAMLKAIFASMTMTAWFLVPFIDSVKHQTTVVQKEDLRMLGTTTQSWISLFEIFASGHDAGNWISLGLPFVVGIMLLLYCLYSYKDTGASNKKEKEKILVFRILCLFSFINVLFVSRVFPWNRLQNILGIEKLGHQLGTIQFAWRFLSIASVLISISVVVALDYIRNNKRYIYKASIIIMAASIVIGCGFFYYSFYDYAGQAKWSNVVSYTGSDNLYFLEGTDATVRNISKCQIKEGEVEVSGYKKVNGKATLHVKNNSQEQEAKITAPIFAYNHYHVNILEGDAVGEELVYDKDDNNCILITVPAGFDGNIIIRFVEPTAWRISEIISLLAWIFVLYRLLVRIRCKVKNRAAGK